MIGLQEGSVLIIRWDDRWVDREIGGDSLGLRAWWLVCRSVGRRHRDGALGWRVRRFVVLVVGNECGRHAAESSERSKLLVARRRETDANVAFVQGNIFVGLFAIFAGPLEGDGVSRYNRNMSKSKGWTLQSSFLTLWMEKTRVNNQTKIDDDGNLLKTC